MQWIHFSDITPANWLWLLLGATMAGFEKSGIKGLSMLVVPMLALQFGGKESSGLVLLLFMQADVFAVTYYRREADWSIVLPLLMPAIIGVLLGAWVGHLLDAAVFETVLAILILSSLLLLIAQEIRPFPEKWVQNRMTGIVAGLLGGFSTMIANAAGPIMAVYLLSMRLPKNSFIGAVVWFFFVINIIKLPFQIFAWHTLSWQSFGYTLSTLPAIAIGFFVGTRIVKRIPEKTFRYFIMGMTMLAALKLFW